MTVTIYEGDCRNVLPGLADDSVDCCVTSPPYWGLRNYDADRQIGMEASVQDYIDTLVAVFSEVRRVLRPDGTLWLNLGDCYTGSGKGGHSSRIRSTNWQPSYGKGQIPIGLKPKELVGLPWRVAFALQADGWYLRSDIVWHKPNPMPESVKDRPTRAHEFIFLFSKSRRYHYDHAAIREAAIDAVRDTLRENGAPSGGGTTYMQARTANEVLKAQTNRVRLQKLKGELIDRAKVMAHVFKLGRQERDAWLTWPARVSAQMAAELSVDAHTMHVTLERYVRQHLSELAEFTARID